MKRTRLAETLGILAAVALVWTGCSTGSGTGDNPGSNTPTSTASATIPTLDKVAGTWVRTRVVDIMDKSSNTVVGSKTKKRTMTIAANGEFTQIDFTKEHHADGSPDLYDSTAYKGTANITGTTASFDITQQYLTNTELTDTDGITGWTNITYHSEYPAIMIDGKLYSDECAYARTGTGTGLAGQWAYQDVESGYDQVFQFEFTNASWTYSGKSKLTTDSVWDVGTPSNGTYSIEGTSLKLTPAGGTAVAVPFIQAGDWFIYNTTYGYTKQ